MSSLFATTSVDALRGIIADSLLQEFLEYQQSIDETLTFEEWLRMTYDNIAKKLKL